MANNIAFGDCLAQFLLIKAWSGSKLAKEINLDQSYVRMWLRGERVPALNTEYVDQITAALLSNLNMKQQELIHNFLKGFDQLAAGIKDGKPLNVLIAGILREAQIYSLSLKSRRKKNTPSYKVKDLSGIMEQMGAGVSSRRTRKDCDYHNIGDIPPFIEGRFPIIRAILAAFHYCISEGNKPSDILVTHQGDNNLFSGYDSQYAVWKSLISEALKKGWSIKYLYRINSDIKRSLKYITEIIEWAGYKNTYMPRFFNKYGTADPPYDFIVIKDCCAFYLFGSNSGNLEKALFYTQKEIVRAICQHVVYMYGQTSSLLKLYSVFDYYEYLASKNRQRGDLYAVTYDLYTPTVPLSLWKKYLQRALSDEELIAKQYDRIRKIVEAFFSDVEKNRVRHICKINALEYMVDKGEYLYLHCFMKPEPEDILTHLNHTIHLLKTYDNFEIALLSESQDNINLPAAVWEVKGGSNVGIITLDMNDLTSSVTVAIAEETISGAFLDYFYEIWECITPKYRDKAYVISWLEERAAYYENKLRSDNRQL